MLDYIYKQYFKSTKKENKIYYLNLYLKMYFKKIDIDDTDFLSDYFKNKKIYYKNEIENIIFEYESLQLKKN